MAKDSTTFDRIVYLFHGGGALGAYQAGVFKGLHDKGYHPNWVIGTSIGAVNSAIIAGNPPETRVQQLHDFWSSIATKMPPTPNTLNNILLERWQHFLSALYTSTFGQPGFFSPRSINPWFGIQSTADKLSYYDTSEFRDTLIKHIDFDRLNEQQVRLSMGSVRVANGTLTYFDNTKMEITPDHVMASCALPPGFPAVAIDNQFYWDGGVHSNTQLNLLLCENEPLRYLCFMVHLFDAYGTRPTNMDDVNKRQKEITYSSHHRQAIYVYRQIHHLRHAIRMLGDNLSPEKKNDPELQRLMEYGNDAIIHLVRFHCKGKLSDLSSKDYEFSLPTILEHIHDGCDDVKRALRDPPWEHPSDEKGLILYEVSDSPIKDDMIFEGMPDYLSIS
jgi:NTE family protein